MQIWDFLIYCQQAEAADAAERAEGNDYMVKTHGLIGLLLALLLLAAPARAAEENTVVIGCDVYAPYTYCLLYTSLHRGVSARRGSGDRDHRSGDEKPLRPLHLSGADHGREHADGQQR